MVGRRPRSYRSSRRACAARAKRSGERRCGKSWPSPKTVGNAGRRDGTVAAGIRGTAGVDGGGTVVPGRSQSGTPSIGAAAATGAVRARKGARRRLAGALPRSLLGGRPRRDPAQHRRPASRGRTTLSNGADERRRARLRVLGLPGRRLMDFAFLSITELGKLLHQKKTSATELATYFLYRLERIGPQLNAVVTVTRERALAEAAEADRQNKTGKKGGPRAGVPYRGEGPP